MALTISLPTFEPELITGLRVDSDDSVDLFNLDFQVSHPDIMEVEILRMNDVPIGPLPVKHGVIYDLRVTEPADYVLERASILFTYTTRLGAERKVRQDLVFGTALSPSAEGSVVGYNSVGWTSLCHPDSPGEELPSTADVVGQLFIKTGDADPGIYTALDLTGTWKLL